MSLLRWGVLVVVTLLCLLAGALTYEMFADAGLTHSNSPVETATQPTPVDLDELSEPTRRMFAAHLQDLERQFLQPSRSERYRLTRVATFTRGSSIEIAMDDSSDQLWVGDFPMYYPSNEERVFRIGSASLEATQIARVSAAIERLDFWGRFPPDHHAAYDGEEWLLEGTRGGRTRIWAVSTPSSTEPRFKQLTELAAVLSELAESVDLHEIEFTGFEK